MQRPLKPLLQAPLLRLGEAVLQGLADRLGAQARVARFLRGRARFDPRDTDIFVATYPRSGTTWMQFILHLLHHSGRDDFEHLTEVSPWWERTLAWRSDGPELLASLPTPRILKSHLPRCWLPNQGRLIYLERDGRDVALSYYQLYRSHLGDRSPFAVFFDRFLRGELQYRSWFKHRRGWRRQRSDPRLLWLRYEDLHEDPGACIQRVARFLGQPLPPLLLAEILEKSDLEYMRARDERFDHIGELLFSRAIEKHAFLRSGLRGAGATALDPDQERRFFQQLHREIRWPALEWRLADFLH